MFRKLVLAERQFSSENRLEKYVPLSSEALSAGSEITFLLCFRGNTGGISFEAFGRP